MSDLDYRSRRMVLREVGEGQVGEFADELGWPLVLDQVENVDEGDPHEVVWAATSAISLHYIEDPVSRNGYVLVWGKEESPVEAFAQMVGERLDTWPLEDLLARVDDAADPADRSEAVLRAGLGAPDEFDSRFFERISAALRDPSTEVREAGLYATLYSAYPQYRPDLLAVAESDPDPERREDAQLFLDAFDAEGVEE